METRILGNTGCRVSVIGLGGAEIGFEREDTGDDRIELLLNSLLDNGSNYIDTAECYADSEELIGMFIGHRRDEYFLATKIGHEVVAGAGPEWSIPQLEATIDRGLKRLRTDSVDLLQLHTCSLDELKKGDVIEVLRRARDASKTRFIGYSGDNEAAMYSVQCGAFDTLQTSFSLLDQGARKGLLDEAKRRGVGVILKRPTSNAMLGADAPWSDYSKPYFERAQAISWPDFRGLTPREISLRYTLAFPFAVMITGTRNPEHFLENIAIAEKGPLPADMIAEINAAFDAADPGWRTES